jgi:hypothetical protein
MDLSFLLQLINPIILGICLLVGYSLKTAFDKFPNKYIPLVSMCLGTIIAIIIHMSSGINAEIVLGGMISGLAATGMYELLRNLLDFDGKKEK